MRQGREGGGGGQLPKLAAAGAALLLFLVAFHRPLEAPRPASPWQPAGRSPPDFRGEAGI